MVDHDQSDRDATQTIKVVAVAESGWGLLSHKKIYVWQRIDRITDYPFHGEGHNSAAKGWISYFPPVSLKLVGLSAYCAWITLTTSFLRNAATAYGRPARHAQDKSKG